MMNIYVIQLSHYYSSNPKAEAKLYVKEFLVKKNK